MKMEVVRSSERYSHLQDHRTPQLRRSPPTVRCLFGLGHPSERRRCVATGQNFCLVSGRTGFDSRLRVQLLGVPHTLA